MRARLKPAGCRCPAAGLQPSQPPGQRGHTTEPPRDVQTELVRVRDCKVSGKTSRRHQSPSPHTRQQEDELLSHGTPATQKRTRAAESSASGPRCTAHSRKVPDPRSLPKYPAPTGGRRAYHRHKTPRSCRSEAPAAQSHTASGRNPSPQPTPPPRPPSRKNSHRGQGVPRSKARRGRGGLRGRGLPARLPGVTPLSEGGPGGEGPRVWSREEGTGDQRRY